METPNLKILEFRYSHEGDYKTRLAGPLSKIGRRQPTLTFIESYCVVDATFIMPNQADRKEAPELTVGHFKRLILEFPVRSKEKGMRPKMEVIYVHPKGSISPTTISSIL